MAFQFFRVEGSSIAALPILEPGRFETDPETNCFVSKWVCTASRTLARNSSKGFREDKDAFIERQPKFMHVANGVIEFNADTPTLMPFDPKYKSQNSSPISFDPDAECPEFKRLPLKNSGTPFNVI